MIGANQFSSAPQASASILYAPLMSEFLIASDCVTPVVLFYPQIITVIKALWNLVASYSLGYNCILICTCNNTVNGVIFAAYKNRNLSSHRNAEENPQTMLYALGALRIFDCLYDIETVSMTIYQPRRENVSTWVISVAELRDWAEKTLKPKAELAFKGEGEYCPGSWCQFCKAAVKCRARADAKLQLAKYEFAQPPLLSDAEIGDILGKLDDLTKWANELMAYAQEAAVNHGKQWPGYKLVESRTNRKYTDEDAVVAAARAAGYTDIFKKSLIPITEMEKLMGKKTFAEVLGGLVVKPKGKPTLVPASDRRPAITTTGAKQDFTDYKGEL